MDNYIDQAAFIRGRIYAMKNRMEKAQRRVAKHENRAEAERAYRLARLIELHEKHPEQAILLYKKVPVSNSVINQYTSLPVEEVPIPGV